MYIYIYTHIYERRKKRIYKVYTSVHSQFSMGHALPQRKEVKADRLRLSAPAVHGARDQSGVPRSTRLAVWLLQRQTLFPLGAVMLHLLSPEETFAWGCVVVS